MQQQSGPTESQRSSNDAVDRLLRQAEIGRLTRNLKTKLAFASLKTQNSPIKGLNSPVSQTNSPRITPISTKESSRRRSKILEGASPSPRPCRDSERNDGSASIFRTKINSRRSSITSISSSSSIGTLNSFASPQASAPQINSVNRIVEVYEEQNDIPMPLTSSTTMVCVSSEPSHEHTVESSLKSTGTIITSSSTLTSSAAAAAAAAAANISIPKTPKLASKYSLSEGTQSLRIKHEPLDEEPLPCEPQTPPSSRRSFPKTPDQNSTANSANDGANLLLHFAQSPGRATPRTPDFNMSDYLHFQTPSPARVGQLTPHRARWGSLSSALFSSGSQASTSVSEVSHSAGSKFSAGRNMN